METRPNPGSSPPAPERSQLAGLDDAELVSLYLDGERFAFQELVNRYQERLLNFIYRTIGDRDRGEDLVQETFVRVYRHLHRFDPTKKFSTWIYTIASNLAKNELRNRSRNPLVLFQAIKKNRPMTCSGSDTSGRRWSGPSRSSPSTTRSSSCCARWRARPTRRSPTSQE
jgi:hypothetical protein